MGLDINGTRFMLYAKSLGVEFSRSAMIGRQSLDLSRSDFKKNLMEFGFSRSSAQVRARYYIERI